MIARFETRFRFFEPHMSRQGPEKKPVRSRRQGADPAFRVGLWLVGLLTSWLLAWLLYRWLFRPLWLANLPKLLEETVALAETAGAFTLAFLWAGLGWRYWRRTRPVAAMAPVSLDELYGLSPKGFERYVAGLFRQKGYSVELRGRSGDLGVDLEVTGPDERRAVVQCKRYQNTVGAEVIRELFGTLVHERATHGFLVTTAEISEAARNWAEGKPLTLIDGEMLVQIATSLREKNIGW